MPTEFPGLKRVVEDARSDLQCSIEQYKQRIRSTIARFESLDSSLESPQWRKSSYKRARCKPRTFAFSCPRRTRSPEASWTLDSGEVERLQAATQQFYPRLHSPPPLERIVWNSSLVEQSGTRSPLTADDLNCSSSSSDIKLICWNCKQQIRERQAKIYCLKKYSDAFEHWKRFVILNKVDKQRHKHQLRQQAIAFQTWKINRRRTRLVEDTFRLAVHFWERKTKALVLLRWYRLAIRSWATQRVVHEPRLLHLKSTIDSD